ncbi:9806_t:CDS:2 [Diversispora eburnea]|uniref:9806_t:CDS:1 n=1 Tax=Diversispora eburnea TaxID=1213867 RepID=A0A9N8VAI2_9GLOM|nr:9806_t:CDS:2 [Diversispora eburnea]
MLLWEIAELKIPYAKERDIASIRDRSWSLGVPHSEWKNLVSNLKNGAWHPDPSFRPTFTEMFLTLEKIYKECDCLTTIDFSAFGDMSVEEAIMEHKKRDGNKKNAWKCFEAHAAVGDITAKYWKGYYLYYNLIDGPEESEQERAIEATKLFKEAADEGDMPEAQLRYGNCLFKGEGVIRNLTEAAIYFKKAAENGNATAMFNMGKIYYYGMGINQDISEGEKYLKLAAYNKQKQAVEMCKEKNISL